jgi:ParB family chromosome partitioning protein
MWDILHFLKNPKGENLNDLSSNPSAEAEKRQINEQLAGALERAAMAIDKVLSKRESDEPGDELSVGIDESDFLTQDLGVSVSPKGPETTRDVAPAEEDSTSPDVIAYEEDSGEKEDLPPYEAVIESAGRDSGAGVAPPPDITPAPIILPEPDEAVESDGGHLLDLAISSVRPNPFQPRTVMGEAELRELSQSIKEFGVLQPILVKSVPGGYELIAGERRLRAAALAGLDEIPAMVVETEPVTQQIIALVENIQRKNLSAIEEAVCINDILSKTGWSQTELSSRMGRSQASIANKLRLLRLDASVQDLVISGKLGERQARSLLSLSTEEQRQLAQRAIDEELSARSLEQLVENWNSRERAPRGKARKNSPDGPAGELLGDIASIVNRHKNRGISAQWKVKQMNQDSMIVEITVDLTGGATGEVAE